MIVTFDFQFFGRPLGLAYATGNPSVCPSVRL